jgi:hypothetical protein
MSAPVSGIQAADQPSAAMLLDGLKGIDAAERRKHETVLDYWLSIRGSRELPPLHDLDPLEISDAGPSSILLELIGSGEDAEVRHLGEALREHVTVDRAAEAPRPSLLASIAKKLSTIAVSRDFLAFHDEFSTAEGVTRCSVTLLPLSSAGAWVDYVYGFVSLETVPAKGEAPVEVPAAEPEAAATEADVEVASDEPAEVAETPEAVEAPAETEEPVEEVAEAPDEPEGAGEAVAEVDEPAPVESAAEEEAAPAEKQKPGFTFAPRTSATGFYGTQVLNVEPTLPAAAAAPDEPEAVVAEEAAAEPEAVEDAAALEEPVAEEAAVEAPAAGDPIPMEEPAAEEAPVEEAAAVADEGPQHPIRASEGTLQSKLTEVRAKADEARMAKLRANVALYEGLSAAYDFALDAEDAPEEYLKLVEAQGLKIQLRSPMRPVVKLAFEGMCDDSTIAQLEAILAWAIEQELPRGSLAERIEAEGGIARILKAA